MKVIVCDKCFNVPKITIINKNQIELECSICNSISPLDLDYFNRFINIKENDDLFVLPKCNYCKNHSSPANLYCFKCSKYICNDCLSNHEQIFEGKGHITIKQKISHQYFCKKEKHEENILNCFCTKCNNYLCCDCKCEHENYNKYNFSDDEDKVNEIKENIKRCQKIIEIEENYFTKFVEKITKKVKALTDLFNDYKKRNTDLISFYQLLLDNYEQLKNIKNYNIRNNLFLNNNFDLKNSTVYYDECLISQYNRLCQFYRDTNHIKTKEYIDGFITPKFCRDEIKKCLILNESILFFMFRQGKEYHLCFVYKNNEGKNKITRMFYDSFIKDIYTLNKDKYCYIDVSNTFTINQIKFVNNSIESIQLMKIQNIPFIINDLYNKNRFFAIKKEEKKDYITLSYYGENTNDNKIYQYGLENKNFMYLITKENIKFNKCLFNDILNIIKESKINNEEKNELKEIFKYENEKDINIEKLIDSNEKLLNLIKKINETEFGKIKNITKDIENKYSIKSNFIIKYLFKLDTNNLNKIEKIVLDYLYKFNELCQKIIEKYIHYLVFNTKINNIYNYNNQFLLFMGENYLISVYSLIEKKFLTLETANLIEIQKNYNNFEIIHIFSDKILLNNKDEKKIYIIENNDLYKFNLVKDFSYCISAQANKNYLLIDNIKNNELLFSLINLNDYSYDCDKSNNFNQLFNFKLQNNPPKLLMNQDFYKFVYLFEDNNQLGIIDCNLNKKFDNINQNEPYFSILLKRDNSKEVIPQICGYSSYYDKDCEPNNILSDKGYFSTKTNKNENISFKFDKEYCFYKILITYPSLYKNAKLKKMKLIIYDKDKNFVDCCFYEINENEKNIFENKYLELNNLNAKGAYIRLEFISNLGADYFVIQKIQFFAEISHSIIVKNK